VTSLRHARAFHEATWSVLGFGGGGLTWAGGGYGLAALCGVGVLLFAVKSVKLLTGVKDWPVQKPSKTMVVDYASRGVLLGIAGMLMALHPPTIFHLGVGLILFILAASTAWLAFGLFRSLPAPQ
jgi:hypothetical protein